MRNFNNSGYMRYFLKSPENVIHKAVVDYLNLQYPESLWVHVPSEGKRTRFEQFVAKMLGLKAGVPDLLIFDEDYFMRYRGLAIELKSAKGKLTENQKEFLKQLENRKWKTAVCYDSETAINIIDEYFKNFKEIDLPESEGKK